MLPIFIKNKKIAFSTQMVRLSGRVLSIDAEDLCTPWGFFVPTDALSLNILEWLRHGGKSIMLQVEECSALLIDHRGGIHELRYSSVDRVKEKLSRFAFRNGNIRTDLNSDICVMRMSRDYIPNLPSLEYALCSVGEYEVNAQIALSQKETIEGAIDLYMGMSRVQTAKYVSLNIDDIVKVLNERGLTQQIPVKWVSEMTPDEIVEFDKIEEENTKEFKIPEKIQVQLD